MECVFISYSKVEKTLNNFATKNAVSLCVMLYNILLCAFCLLAFSIAPIIR